MAMHAQDRRTQHRLGTRKVTTVKLRLGKEQRRGRDGERAMVDADLEC